MLGSLDIERDLLQRLHEKEAIDKNYVLWWEMGFEGRRVFSEEEFEQGLEEVTYEVRSGNRGFTEPRAETFKVWVCDEVPIVYRDFVFPDGEVAKAFVTIKPMSHYGIHGCDGWESLEFAKKIGSRPEIFHIPHFRGIVIEETSEFLFWHPLVFGTEPDSYATRAHKLEGHDIPFMLCPVHPAKFCKNLIKDGWSHGKRSQKKSKNLEIEQWNYEFVPYYEFDYRQNHVTLYPVNVFDREMDFPGIIVGSAETKMPTILGIGYADSGGGFFWDLDKTQYRRAKNSLIRRFGKV
jgi:hypothetical protein